MPPPPPANPAGALAARLARSRRWNAVLLGTSLAAVAALVWSLAGGPDVELGDPQRLLEAPGVRERVVQELLARNPAVFDSHPDPDVARLLSPSLPATDFLGARVASDRWGLREREFELPKPSGTVRVVLLGDSFVFGLGIPAKDRMGVFLERWLGQRARARPGPVEVLHVGIGSWGAVAECEFLRRQLAEYDPDLVVQLLVENDLDDNAGVRGFGARAKSVPRAPRQTSAMVTVDYPVPLTGRGNTNFLLDGYGWESVHRYEELARVVGRLSRAVDARGGRYVLAASWGVQARVLAHHLEDALRPEQVFWLPAELRSDPRLWVEAGDSHWNEDGNELFARLLYGLVRERGLLPQLDLGPWPEAEAEARRAVETGAEQARGRVRPGGRLTRATASLAFEEPAPEVFRQVFTGVDPGGLAAPYASLLLAVEGGERLLVRGRRLGRHELAGGTATVWVEDRVVGRFELDGEERLDLGFDLPELPAATEFVNVRFESDDYVYTGPARREMASFLLETIAITPR